MLLTKMERDTAFRKCVHMEGKSKPKPAKLISPNPTKRVAITNSQKGKKETHNLKRTKHLGQPPGGTGPKEPSTKNLKKTSWPAVDGPRAQHP